jgi:hypothetical protein
MKQALQPATMLATPGSPLSEDETASSEELQDVVARAKDLPLEATSAADQVPNPFFGRRRDADGHQLSGSIQTAQLDGIAPIVLALFSRAHRRQRRGHHVAVKAPVREFSVKHIAGAAGFIAGPDFPTGLPALEEPAKLTKIVGELLDDLRLPGVASENGYHHRVLVDIHSNPDN